MPRRIQTHREQVSMLSPWRTAMPRADAYDLNRQNRPPDQAPELPGPWFHRTKSDLQPGDYLDPYHSSNFDYDVMSMGDEPKGNWAPRNDWVFMDKYPSENSIWGPNLYRVEPEGEGPYPWNGMSTSEDVDGYVAPRAKVVERIEDPEAYAKNWHSQYVDESGQNWRLPGRRSPTAAAEDNWSHPQEDEGFDAWRTRLWDGLSGQGRTFNPNPTGNHFRSMSDEEYQAGTQAGEFRPLIGDHLYVTDDPDRFGGGGSFGAKGGGHIVEFSPQPTEDIPSYYGNLMEKGVRSIPADAVQRVWDWDGSDHKPQRRTSSRRLAMPALYRGLEHEFDPGFDADLSEPSGYTHWTDNSDLAREYAGPKGHVYQYDLPDEAMGDSYIDDMGERPLYYDADGRPELNGVKGREYLVYHDHDDYDPSKIKKVTRRQAAESIPYQRNNNGVRSHNGQPIPGFGTDREPWGRYMSEDAPRDLPEGWERGTVDFENPLHVEHNDGDWKQELSDEHGGLTGQGLSDALLAKGHDGVISHDKYGIGEIVDIRPKGQRGHRVGALRFEVHPGVRTDPVYGGDVSQLRAHDDTGLVGVMEWRGDGEVHSVAVPKSRRREGIGTQMFDWAKANAHPDLHHSEAQTPSGAAWAGKTAAEWDPDAAWEQVRQDLARAKEQADQLRYVTPEPGVTMAVGPNWSGSVPSGHPDYIPGQAAQDDIHGYLSHEDDGYVNFIHTSPQMRRNGIGTKLLDQAGISDTAHAVNMTGDGRKFFDALSGRTKQSARRTPEEQAWHEKATTLPAGDDTAYDLEMDPDEASNHVWLAGDRPSEFPDLEGHIRQHGIQRPIELDTDGTHAIVTDGQRRLHVHRQVRPGEKVPVAVRALPPGSLKDRWDASPIAEGGDLHRWLNE